MVCFDQGGLATASASSLRHVRRPAYEIVQGIPVAWKHVEYTQSMVHESQVMCYNSALSLMS